MTTTHEDAAAARAAALTARTAELREALESERMGYVRRGLPARVAAVDEQIRAIDPDYTSDAEEPDAEELDAEVEPEKPATKPRARRS